MKIHQLTLFNITDPFPANHDATNQSFYQKQLMLKLKIAFEERGEIDVELNRKEN